MKDDLLTLISCMSSAHLLLKSQDSLRNPVFKKMASHYYFYSEKIQVF